jgi:hypothetical protein
MDADKTEIKETETKKPKIERINFDELIKQLSSDQAADWGKDQLTIVGGLCPVDQLGDFLQSWKLIKRQMTYALWETVSDSCLTDTQSILDLTEFPQAEYLEYCRFFGEEEENEDENEESKGEENESREDQDQEDVGPKGGDLTLRRGEDGFQWWFIGPAQVKDEDEDKDKDKEEEEYGAESFWDTGEPDTKLHRHAESALLWGKYDDQVKRWYEDRVARATLAYPHLSGNPERVQLNYWSFTNKGQVAFVWLRNLEAYDG